MQVDLNRVIEQVSKEKGIDKTIVINAVEEMMHSAARRTFGPDRNIESRFNPELGEIELFEIKTVVDKVNNAASEADVNEARAKYDPEAEVGDEILIKLDTATMGRIAAQAAKQNLIQHIRDAERKQIFNEFKDRKQEVVSGIVQRFERKNMIVNLGRTEAILPEKEQIPHERYRQGDRIRALILDVDLSEKGLSIVLSRTSNDFLMKLFEQEVPEIYDNTVVIKGCAREAGERTKIAVSSRDRDVDSVGACVGMKGMRVQSIIRELRGEKIDIIEFNDDPVSFATHALSPAKISRVSIIDSVEKHMEVIVDDTQLSLAIGKKGQNVRLAAKLLGWRIDIKSEEEKRQEVESQMAALVVPGAPVTVLMDHGLAETVAEKLMEAGVATVEKLGAMTPEQLEEIPGIEQEMVENIQSAVVAYYGQFEEQPAAETAATEEASETVSQPATETPAEASGEKASENESDRIESTEVPAAAPDSGKGAAELS